MTTLPLNPNSISTQNITFKGSRQQKFKAADLPDEVVDNYLIFSFVRDPFTRVLSSYHEASPGYSFEGLLSEGVSSGKLNVHFRSQTAQLLSITTSTGRRIRLDFVGRLEHFEEDFALLLPAIKARHLSPGERRDLIRNAALTSISGVALKLLIERRREDTKRDRHSPMQPEVHGKDPSLPLTRWHELMICQAYIQDFACFGYGLPAVCFEYPEVFFNN
eukprot:FR739663.1.p1 GENE.FR739663.1~~FR739663.1.p1  ORF type:complete len:219 (+),score=5.93 FR739663.1:64-720(+)